MPPRSKVRHLLSWARSILIFDPLIYIYTVVLGTGSLISSLWDKSGRLQHNFARLWSWLILKTSLCPLEIEGLDRVDTSRPHLYAANHLSAFDIPALYVGLPFQFRIMAKQELFRYPFLGWHLRRSGQVPIDPQSSGSAIRSLKRSVHTLREGMPLVIFPEGGRSETGHIQPFQSGAFFIAIKAQVEIIPIAIIGSYEVLKQNTYHIKPGRIRLLFGEPISTVGCHLRDMDAISNRVRDAIAELYYAHHPRFTDPRKLAAEAEMNSRVTHPVRPARQ
jgi:1-acyl-sn-glycerol-3-phosphate acyltransferase